MLSENTQGILEMFGVFALPGAVTCGLYLWLRGWIRVVAIAAVFLLLFVPLALLFVASQASSSPQKCGAWIYTLYALAAVIVVSMMLGLGTGWGLSRWLGRNRQKLAKPRQKP